MNRTDYTWVLLSSNSSEIEIDSFVDHQKQWKKKASQLEACLVCPVRFPEHTEQYMIYQCNSPNCAQLARELHGPPCSWFLRTTICGVTKRGTIEQHGDHLSSIPDAPTSTLNFTMKRFIRDNVKEKYKPSRILSAIIDEGLDAWLGDNYVDEMERTLWSPQYHPGLAENVTFRFGFPTDATGYPALSRVFVENPVVIGFATKQSIRNLELAADHPLHVDATFKLNTARFPAVVVGVSDVRRQLHPVAFFIMSDLRQQQLETVFRETFKLNHTVTGKTARVGYTMADADVAEQNALEAVIAQDLEQRALPVHLMCFFHVMQNVKKYLASVPIGLRPLALKHVYRLHYARFEVEFDKRATEAVQAWKSEPALRDFERLFLDTAGLCQDEQSMERFDKEIKRDYSLRTLVLVNALAQAFLDMCHHRACRAIPFATTPRPSEKQARRYKALKKQGRLVVTSHYRASIAFVMGGGDRQVFRVLQNGSDVPKRVRKKTLSTKEDLAQADQKTEVQDQPPVGWLVDLDTSMRDCRSWRKFGHCVHLIAARRHQELPVDGVQIKRTFEVKGSKQGQGRRAEVGHALSCD